MKLQEQRFFVPYLHQKGGLWVGDPKISRRELFSFRHAHTSVVYTFDIQMLIDLMKSREKPFHHVQKLEAVVDEHQGNFIRRHHGIEEERVMRVAASRLDEPGILCEMPDRTSTVVDGNHRFVARARVGLKNMNFFFLVEPQWKLCLLNIPVEIGEAMAMRGRNPAAAN